MFIPPLLCRDCTVAPIPMAIPSRTVHTRAISASNVWSSHMKPKTEALYESDGADAGEGHVPLPVADGSQEQVEK